ncbi:cytochrome c [Pantoea rwandensis]|uniref:Alcohol dehydrogenase n=1 Tax=Pantoea rwandensis TaxID=1076550 RepID=A0A1X1D514_9GAMM|nr:cytochrome c [Pantoea rwandensis]ORM71782.1 alcohol dehydrogenase [Pantoea rwandensis]
MIKFKHILWVVSLFVVLALAWIGYKLIQPVGSEPTAGISGAPADISDPVKRGEYLTRAADCVACHTATGGAPFAGGFPIQLPFGTIYGSNITADKETGIGNWTDEQFINAVRKGISPNGNLYPAMPYTSYTGMSRDDVLAVKAYLMTLPPVNKPTPENVLPFPFNQRWGMKFWNLAFFTDQRFSSDPSKDAEWNRGAYLATALGHCGECHTPRNIGFAVIQSKALSGENIQGWFAGNITPDAETGIGSWTEKQLSQFLAEGHAAGRSTASGPMAEAVENSLQYLTPADNAALVKYLRNIEPIKQPSQSVVNTSPKDAINSSAILPAEGPIQPGQQLFANDCSGCHQWNGIGRQSDYANLAGSSAVNDPQGRSVVQAILKGTKLKIGSREYFMPDFGNKYSDQEVADVANYIIKHFGDKTGQVTTEQVASQRKQ